MSFVHVQAGVFGGEAVLWKSTFSSGEYFFNCQFIIQFLGVKDSKSKNFALINFFFLNF